MLDSFALWFCLGYVCVGGQYRLASLFPPGPLGLLPMSSGRGACTLSGPRFGKNMRSPVPSHRDSLQDQFPKPPKP
eukprot:4892873-Amphidinium_carterae.1